PGATCEFAHEFAVILLRGVAARAPVASKVLTYCHAKGLPHARGRGPATCRLAGYFRSPRFHQLICRRGQNYQQKQEIEGNSARLPRRRGTVYAVAWGCSPHNWRIPRDCLKRIPCPIRREIDCT